MMDEAAKRIRVYRQELDQLIAKEDGGIGGMVDDVFGSAESSSSNVKKVKVHKKSTKDSKKKRSREDGGNKKEKIKKSRKEN
jgi:hypothetical protein